MSLSSVPSVSSAQAGLGQAAAALGAAAPVVRERVGAVLTLRKPWAELADRGAFSRPESVGDAISRARKNANYFKVRLARVRKQACKEALCCTPLPARPRRAHGSPSRPGGTHTAA